MISQRPLLVVPTCGVCPADRSLSRWYLIPSGVMPMRSARIFLVSVGCWRRRLRMRSWVVFWVVFWVVCTEPFSVPSVNISRSAVERWFTYRTFLPGRLLCGRGSAVAACSNNPQTGTYPDPLKESAHAGGTPSVTLSVPERPTRATPPPQERGEETVYTQRSLVEDGVFQCTGQVPHTFSSPNSRPAS